jgi:hypothetical protein
MVSTVFEPVERRVVARLQRVLATKHATCPDWAYEIPEPMFRQLVRDSLLRTAVFFGLTVAVVSTGAAEYQPAHAFGTSVVWLIFLSLLVLTNWRKLATQCVDREFLYRRQHGKWRWER